MGTEMVTFRELHTADALLLLPNAWDVGSDIEDGYSGDPSAVAELVAELVAIGVAGVNLEDSAAGHLVDASLAAAEIAEVKRRSPDVFVNARVDNLWFGEDATVEAVLARARSYAPPPATSYADMQSRMEEFSRDDYRENA